MLNGKLKVSLLDKRDMSTVGTDTTVVRLSNEDSFEAVVGHLFLFVRDPGTFDLIKTRVRPRMQVCTYSHTRTLTLVHSHS